MCFCVNFNMPGIARSCVLTICNKLDPTMYTYIVYICMYVLQI